MSQTTFSGRYGIGRNERNQLGSTSWSPSGVLFRSNDSQHVPLKKGNTLSSKKGNLPSAHKTKMKKRKPTYATYFHKVFKIRMRYYYRLSLLLSILLSILIALPYGGNIFVLPVKIMILWASFCLLKIARDATIRVSLSGASSEFQHIVSCLFSTHFLIVYGCYAVATGSIFLIIYNQSSAYLNYSISSPTKTVKPFLNDSFMFFWYFSMFVSSFYSSQFIIFEKNMLPFKIGVYRCDPTDYLKNIKWSSLLKEATAIAGCIAIFAAPVYFWFRRLIFNVFFSGLVYGTNLNSQIPAIRFSIIYYLWLCILSFAIVFTYELLNRIYNAYAMVGCLIVKKPISSYGDNQFDVLTTGIADYEYPLVRLTAYQELVYRSVCTNISERRCLYEDSQWLLVLNEAAKLIRSNSKVIKMDILPKKAPVKSKIPENNSAPNDDTPNIFGRSGQINIDTGNDLDKANLRSRRSMFSTNINSPEDLFLKHDSSHKPVIPKKKQSLVSVVVKKCEAYIFSLVRKFGKQLKEYILNQRKKSAFLQKVDRFITKDKIIWGSYRKEADRRIPDKIIVGNAIIVISEMLLHAKSEDKKNRVESTLTEVLTILTSIYKSTSLFLDHPPVTPKSINEKEHNSIKEINDLAISYFFKIVVFYNSSLNDLILGPDTFKLAKWCTDMALEEQKSRGFSEI
ncbi:DEBR0S3_07536g1_1 [Brettanomyces bruxellensis]|uniref:DEBR0S3_07536g1_1 n=1 Tax=Dekkera bruxellensis TaxID=5007 RepID=A0A7D9CXN8_DEKBR|nr:DEBR0S3_07536g1_1 [Brettanomyces bruxellensis]